MTNVAVKDAKDMYIETGRLNRNIISKEISISWYKCKLQNINPKDAYKITGEKPTINFESKFLTYVDTIVPQYFDYMLVNMSLQKCSSRMQLSNFDEMDTIDDLAIGTNGGYLTYKTHTNQLVSQDEHYLECLSNYFTYGIMVKHGEKMIGVLMLLSEEMPNEYDIAKIREKLVMYNAKANAPITEAPEYIAPIQSIKQLFAYPKRYMEEFERLVDKIGNNALPIIVYGDKGSGKSTFARLLAETNGKFPFIISLNDTPRALQKHYVENGLSHYDTVVIESLEDADPDLLRLLTVYTEEVLIGKVRDKQSDYKCSKLILTTAYDDKSNEKSTLSNFQMRQLSKFADKLKLNTVNLLNTKDFLGEIDDLIEAMLLRNNIKVTDAYRVKLTNYVSGHSFKKAQQMIEISMDDNQLDLSELLSDFPISISETILDLESYEKEYILKIYDLLDNNMSATASILNIGRSTLYRKLEKYQNDTTEKQK